MVSRVDLFLRIINESDECNFSHQGKKSRASLGVTVVSGIIYFHRVIADPYRNVSFF